MSPVMLLMLLVVVVAPGALAKIVCNSLGRCRDIPVVKEDPVTHAQKQTEEKLLETTTTLEVTETTAATEADARFIEQTEPPKADTANVKTPETEDELQEPARKPEGNATVAAGGPPIIEPMVPPKACTMYIPMTATYEGRCVMVNKMHSACHAGSHLDALHPGCPKMPQLRKSERPSD